MTLSSSPDDSQLRYLVHSSIVSLTCDDEVGCTVCNTASTDVYPYLLLLFYSSTTRLQ